MTRRRGEQGSAVVDFVLVTMIVVPLFLAVLQLGFFLYIRTTMVAAASDGARLAATADRGPDEGVARTESMIRAALSSRVLVSVSAESAEIDGQPAVEIVVTGRMPAFGPWGPTIDDFTVSGHGIEETP